MLATGCVQVVEHLSEELQVHRELLTTGRDDRAREIEELRSDVERQRQRLAHYERAVTELRALVDDLLSRQHPLHDDDVLLPRTTPQPQFPTGALSHSSGITKGEGKGSVVRRGGAKQPLRKYFTTIKVSLMKFAE